MERTNNQNLIIKNVAIVSFFVGLVLFIIMIIQCLPLFMDTPGDGSMYLFDNELYYGGKEGGIYKYNVESDKSMLLVKNADNLFSAEDEIIYYTYKNCCYELNLSNQKGKQVDNYQNNKNLIYSISQYNTEEVKEILEQNEDILADDPFAIYRDDVIFVAHNRNGGYIAVYKVSCNEERVVIQKDTKKILDYSYSMWQPIVHGVGDIRISNIFSNKLFGLIISIMLMILSVCVIKRRVIINEK